MNLYADTSALVKRYIQEIGSKQVAELFYQFPVIGTAALTKAEMASAMSKAVRLGFVNEAKMSIAWQDFLSHWPTYIRLPVSIGTVERAASLIWLHGLRAFDAIHLANALIWKDLLDDEIVFACFDNNLVNAASREGLQIWPT